MFTQFSFSSGLSCCQWKAYWSQIYFIYSLFAGQCVCRTDWVLCLSTSTPSFPSRRFLTRKNWNIYRDSYWTAPSSPYNTHASSNLYFPNCFFPILPNPRTFWASSRAILRIFIFFHSSILFFVTEERIPLKLIFICSKAAY